RPLIDRTLDHLQRALDDAHLTATQIDRVVLVGGSTRTPMIGELLEERLGQPPHQEVNPDLCVAMGASIQAAIIAGEQNVGAGLGDTTPPTLGIRCVEGRPGYSFGPKSARIVHRNTALPASMSDVFYTMYDRQREVDIEVFQGESEDVRHNYRVGRFRIEGLAPVPAGNEIVVQFDVSLDGTLKVSARERATGLQKAVTIENPFAHYEREERAAAQERLNMLWAEGDAGEDYEDDWEGDEFEEMGAGEAADESPPELVPGPREGQREAVQARALLEKAERLMDRVQPADKPEVERLMERVRTALTERRSASL